MPATTVCQTASMLFLHAQTALHPGSGTALGVVDLPVQRERHTQWPVIPASAIKGILRDACRRNGTGDDLLAAFGPETSEAEKHAGSLAITDARLLAFPVRSLKGVFAWVTCPAVLERLMRDSKLAGADAAGLRLPTVPGKEESLCPKNSPLLIESSSLILEEFEFKRTGEAEAVANWISQRVVSDPATAERLKSHLVVLHDDDFTHFVRHATEIVARIALDYERKTVKQGALFYQEFLPAETLFYSLVLANASRRDGHTKSAAEILDYLVQNVAAGSVLQIGGDETTGKGFCTVQWFQQ